MVERTRFTGDLDQKGRYTSFIFGVLLVIFFWALGLGIDNAVTAIDLSSQLVTITRSASIGLGTGYYLGATLIREETSERWVFLGIFLTIAAGTMFTSINSVISNTISINILLEPIVILSGGLVSILAHRTPAVQTNREYKSIFRFISGYATTIVVVVLASINYILSILDTLIAAISGNVFLYIAIAVVIFLFGIVVGTGSGSSSDE